MANDFIDKESIINAGFQKAADDGTELNFEGLDEYVAVRANPRSTNMFGRTIQDITRSIDQMQGTGYGLMGAVGSAIGAEGMQDAGIEGFRRNEREAAENPGTFSSFSDVNWTSPGDVLEFGRQTIAENALSFLPGLAIGGVGGKLGQVVARKAATEFMEGLIAKHGVEAAGKMVAKRVAIAETVSRAMGVEAGTGGQEAGSIYGDISKDNPEAGGIALATGAVAGMFDALPQFMVLQKVLGKPVTEKIVDYTAKTYGKEMAKTLLTESGTEGIQTIIEKIAPRIADPTKGEFSSEDWHEVLDATIKGGFAGAGLAQVGELPQIVKALSGKGKETTLKPDPSPAVNAEEEDINQKADDLAGTPEPNQLDNLVTQLSAQNTLLESMKEVQNPDGEQLQKISDQEKLIADITGQINALQTPPSHEEGAATNQDGKPPETVEVVSETTTPPVQDKAAELVKAEQAIIAHDEVVDPLIMSESLTPEESAKFTETRKQLVEARDTIQAEIEGSDEYVPPERDWRDDRETFTMEHEAAGNEAIDEATNNLLTGRKELGKRLKTATAEALRPFATMIGALGIKVETGESKESTQNDDAIYTGDSMHVKIGDDGLITTVIQQPRNVNNPYVSEDSIVNDIQPKRIEEEMIHVAHVQGIKDRWVADGKKVGFKEFFHKHIANVAGDIRKASSNKTIGAIASGYFMKPGATFPDTKQGNMQLVAEFTRMVAQKTRTGQITEDVQVLARQKALGSKPASAFLGRIIQSLRTIKSAILRFSKKAPARFQKDLDTMNAILDRYDVVNKRSAEKINDTSLESSEAPEGAEPPPAEESPTTGILSAGNDVPESEKTSFSLPKSGTVKDGVYTVGLGNVRIAARRESPKAISLSYTGSNQRIVVTSQEELDSVLDKIKKDHPPEETPPQRQPLYLNSEIRGIKDQFGFESALLEVIHRLRALTIRDRASANYYGGTPDYSPRLTAGKILDQILHSVSIAPDELDPEKIDWKGGVSKRISDIMGEETNKYRSNSERKAIAVGRLKTILNRMVDQGLLTKMDGGTVTEYYPTEVKDREIEGKVVEDFQDEVKRNNKPLPKTPDINSDSLEEISGNDFIVNDNQIGAGPDYSEDREEATKDFQSQAEWIDNHAKAIGYSGLTHLAQSNYDLYERLTKQWRERNKRDDISGEFLNNKQSNKIDEKLFSTTGQEQAEGSDGLGGTTDTANDALSYIKANGGTGDEAARGQRGSLVEWARSVGRLIDRLPRQFRFSTIKDYGASEHHVFYDPESGRFVKFTRGTGVEVGNVAAMGRYGWKIERGTPAEYLQRIIDSNKALGDDVRVHGIYEDDRGNVSIITSQPTILGTKGDIEGIRDSFESMGFRAIGDSGFYRKADNLAILDAHDENGVMVDALYVPFDVIVTHPEGEIRADMEKLFDMSKTRRQEDEDFNLLAAGPDLTDEQIAADKAVTSDVADELITRSIEGLPITEPQEYYSQINAIFGDLASLKTRYTKNISEDVSKAWQYIAKNGYMATASRILNGTIRGLTKTEKFVATTFLYSQSQAYRDAISADKTLTFAQKQELRDQSILIERSLESEIETMANEWGRLGPVINWMRNNFGGSAATSSYQKLAFDAVNQIEQVLGKENLTPFADMLQKKLTKGVDKVFTETEFLAKMQSFIRKFSEDPEKLFKEVYGSLAKTSAKIYSSDIIRAARDMMDPTGSSNMENIARRIASMIDVGMSGEKDSPNEGSSILNKALTKFAKDHLGEFFKIKKAEKPSKVQILSEIIVNDTMRKEFVTALQKEVADKFPLGKHDPGYKEQFDGVFEAMNDSKWSESIQNEAVDEVARSLKLSIPKIVERTFGREKTTNLFSLKGEERKQAYAKIKEEFRKSLPGIPSKVVDALVEGIGESLNAQAVAYMESTFKFKRGADGKFDLTDQGNLKGGKAIREAVRLSDMVRSLRDITAMGVSNQQSFIHNLAKEYVQQLGLPESMANGLEQLFKTELQDALQWQKDKDINAQINRIKGNLKDQKKAPKTNEGIIDNLVKAAARGYLGEETIYESIRQKYNRQGLPPYSPEVAQWLADQADDLQNMPEGEEKNERRQEIANYLANQKGLTKGEMMTSWYYFSLLSGPTTFLVNNPGANAVQLLFNTAAYTMVRPKTGIKALGALASAFSKGSRGWDNFFRVMQTGYAPTNLQLKYSSNREGNQITDLAALPVERITKDTNPTFAKLAWGPKMLQRFMVATDQLFSSAATDVLLASYGITATPEINEQAREKAAAEFAAQGKPIGTDTFRRRVRAIADDLVAEQNPGLIQNVAQKALESSFSQTPKGAIGSLAKFIGSYGTKFWPVKMVFPFTNVVANVFNESMNYIPSVGIWRYTRNPETGEWGVTDENGKKVRDNELLAKQGLGLLIAVTLFAMSGEDDDDNIVIYGQGPSDPEHRKALQQRGWRPNTIKIGGLYFSYLLTPAAPLLAAVGQTADLKRDGKLEDKDTMEKVFTLFATAMTSILNQSFLQGGVQAIGVLQSRDPGGAAQKFIASSISGATTPNIVKQIGRWINPTIYDAPTFWGKIVKDTPVVNATTLNPALNVFGEPVYRREVPILGRNASPVLEGDPVLNFYYGNGLRIPGFDQSFVIGGQKMTPDQQRDFVLKVGPEFKARLAAMQPSISAMIKNKRVDAAQDMVDDLASSLKRQARNQMKVKNNAAQTK